MSGAAELGFGGFWGLRFRVWGLGFRVLGFGVWGLWVGGLGVGGLAFARFRVLRFWAFATTVPKNPQPPNPKKAQNPKSPATAQKSPQNQTPRTPKNPPKAPKKGSFKFYGMGTFNLDWSIGEDAYGHVGDTYGYQSQTTYVPGFDFVISAPWRISQTLSPKPSLSTDPRP